MVIELVYFYTLFIHMKKASYQHKAGGYEIIHPCTFQMSRKPPPFFHIFQFLIRRTQQISQWTITAPRISHDDYQLSMKTTRDHEDDGITHDDDQLSTKPIGRKRLEILKTMVSWKQKIFEEESLFEDIVCYNLYLIIGML